MKWVQCLVVAAIFVGMQGSASALEDVDVAELRGQFEEIIRAEIKAISEHLDETLKRSGLSPADLDAVIRKPAGS